MSWATIFLLAIGRFVWLGVAAWLIIGLRSLPPEARAAGDWIVFGLWLVTLPLLFLYDLLIWLRRKWAVRHSNRGSRQ